MKIEEVLRRTEEMMSLKFKLVILDQVLESSLTPKFLYSGIFLKPNLYMLIIDL